MKLFKHTFLLSLLFIGSLYSLQDAGAATLSASPSNIAQGGAVIATWSGIVNPAPKDWIGLYAAGAGDGSYQHWVYVSCSRTAVSAVPSGSCPFGIPSNLPNGAYELRLFANDGFARLASSIPFNVSPVPPPSTRYVDNGDGTVTDLQTGLMWEKKLAADGSEGGTCNDGSQANRSIHCANNHYMWSSTGTNPDGTLFTDFLTRINKVLSTSADGRSVADVCFAGYCDWRMPNIAELQVLRLAQCNMYPLPCIDPIFGPTGSRDEGAIYWSSTTHAALAGNVWGVFFTVDAGGGNGVGHSPKSLSFFARAVRGAR